MDNNNLPLGVLATISHVWHQNTNIVWKLFSLPFNVVKAIFGYYTVKINDDVINQLDNKENANSWWSQAVKTHLGKRTAATVTKTTPLMSSNSKTSNHANPLQTPPQATVTGNHAPEPRPVYRKQGSLKPTTGGQHASWEKPHNIIPTPHGSVSNHGLKQNSVSQNPLTPSSRPSVVHSQPEPFTAPVLNISDENPQAHFQKQLLQTVLWIVQEITNASAIQLSFDNAHRKALDAFWDQNGTHCEMPPDHPGAPTDRDLKDYLSKFGPDQYADTSKKIWTPLVQKLTKEFGITDTVIFNFLQKQNFTNEFERVYSMNAKDLKKQNHLDAIRSYFVMYTLHLKFELAGLVAFADQLSKMLNQTDQEESIYSSIIKPLIDNGYLARLIYPVYFQMNQEERQRIHNCELYQQAVSKFIDSCTGQFQPDFLINRLENFLSLLDELPDEIFTTLQLNQKQFIDLIKQNKKADALTLLEKAKRNRCLAVHPDKHQEKNAKAKAHAEFINVMAAYRTIIDRYQLKSDN